MKFKLIVTRSVSQCEFGVAKRLGAGIHILAEATPTGGGFSLNFKA